MITEDLPPEAMVALGYAPRAHRSLFELFLSLDRNLARSVAGASEPIVGQLRLAWWRDALGSDDGTLPAGNPLLDAIAASFGSERRSLAKLVDGWEAFLLADPVDGDGAQAFAAGRAAGWLAVARKCAVHADTEAIEVAARRWALAELADNIDSAAGRDTIMTAADHLTGPTVALPRELRPLAVLDALARRAIARGGGPLLADRGSALVALRAGLLGR
ncbi:hypothetical protein P8Q88_05025 [Qipengyuania sp. XHP0207]|uniref:hypothetical protein n=1 Tax=Qipengyuania sp. XHP0207 TaxID=3038078 RepID=UPI00241C00A4|nr:hypothetical protein [Qipengyuania sp. XHP0207]MDG5747536.1 hypothetical protein [Qipengyuania sp. XHP0207]